MTTTTWKWYTSPFWPFASLLNISFTFGTDASIPEIFRNWSFLSKLLFQFKFAGSFPELKLQFFNQTFLFKVVALFTTWEINSHSKLFSNCLLRLNSNLCSENWSFNCGKEVSIPGTKVWFRKQRFDSRKESFTSEK